MLSPTATATYPPSDSWVTLNSSSLMEEDYLNSAAWSEDFCCYRVKKSFASWKTTSRLMSEMASVRGSCFGQASTQFWAKPHSCTPPSPARARRRSSFRTAPAGSILKRLTWAMVAAPTEVVDAMKCGETSMQLGQE